MIDRYADPRITKIWSLQNKFALWQKVELTVPGARAHLKLIPDEIPSKLEHALLSQPIDVEFILEREKVLHHDLNSFLDERMQHLSPELRLYFHQKMTSYDTEEAPFATMLKESADLVVFECGALLEAIKSLALRYRFTPMNARTHGQEAEMQTFGRRCLTWYQEIRMALQTVEHAMSNLRFSKLSGAIGTHSSISPELEKTALRMLNLEPFPGSTQIMPRVLYSPLASGLADLVTVVERVATDIRLGSRSGRPLWHEPFGKKQKGSSAMPQKKNNILTEKICGMGIMARQYAAGLRDAIRTWEERDIAQSSLERVFWPDLYHVTIHALGCMTKVMRGLVVYPDRMLTEIVESRGTYASNMAKEVLTTIGIHYGLDREEAYRIIQLACFNAFAPPSWAEMGRTLPAQHLESMDDRLTVCTEHIQNNGLEIISIEDIVKEGKLQTTPELEASADTVENWNQKLKEIFDPNKFDNRENWGQIFLPSHILANEAHLFKEVFRV